MTQEKLKPTIAKISELIGEDFEKWNNSFGCQLLKPVNRALGIIVLMPHDEEKFHHNEYNLLHKLQLLATLYPDDRIYWLRDEVPAVAMEAR